MTVSGADYGENGVTAADVSITVDDDETASSQIALTVDEISVSESAGSTTVTVTATLDSAPLTSDTAVTVTVGDSSDAAAEGADYAQVERPGADDHGGADHRRGDFHPDSRQ